MFLTFRGVTVIEAVLAYHCAGRLVDIKDWRMIMKVPKASKPLQICNVSYIYVQVPLAFEF